MCHDIEPSSSPIKDDACPNPGDELKTRNHHDPTGRPSVSTRAIVHYGTRLYGPVHGLRVSASFEKRAELEDFTPIERLLADQRFGWKSWEASIRASSCCSFRNCSPLSSARYRGLHRSNLPRGMWTWSQQVTLAPH